MNKETLLQTVEEQNKANRSAWDKGVNSYMYELVEDLEQGTLDNLDNKNAVIKALLNGATNWKEFSWGGSSLIYNEDIAERLCNNTELKRSKNGLNRPNRNEEWLDVQARALFQAGLKLANLIVKGV